VEQAEANVEQVAASDARAGGFEAHRSRLFGVAYRMLGSRAEAEDAVQEAYLRWHRADRAAIRDPLGWLVTTTTRLAIDRLRALKIQREAYVGPWLPEPLLGRELPRPDQAAELASDLSVAFVVLLERLAPEERAAFLLRDVFDCGYPEIARTLDRSEASCRQIVHRARERVRAERRRFQATETARVRLLRKFLAAAEARDERALLELFSPDATWTSDGGARVPAARRVILGRERIVRLVLGLETRLYRERRASRHLAAVNGQTGFLTRMEGRLFSATSIATDGERIFAVYTVLNPDKLAWPPSAARARDSEVRRTKGES
jgi:RNA polymerase sigma-70 factor (ECF subfamily)